jgi:hypothetical protein
MVEHSPIQLHLCCGMSGNHDLSFVFCRVEKDASEWSYHPTCTSPMCQPGRVQVWARCQGVLETGTCQVGDGFPGTILDVSMSLSTTVVCVRNPMSSEGYTLVMKVFFCLVNSV